MATAIDLLASEISLKMPRSWGQWHFYRSRWLVHSYIGNPAGSSYSIDLWSINTHQSLVDWFCHVGPKELDSAGFVQALGLIFQPAGYLGTFNGKDLAERYWKSSSGS